MTKNQNFPPQIYLQNFIFDTAQLYHLLQAVNNRIASLEALQAQNEAKQGQTPVTNKEPRKPRKNAVKKRSQIVSRFHFNSELNELNIVQKILNEKLCASLRFEACAN